MEESPSSVIIKQEKVTPDREIVNDDIEKLLDSNLFGDKDESLDKKEIEPTKTSDQLLEELFGVFGANVNIPDILNNTEKRSKKKKKRKHDESDDSESTKSKHKKSKKSKKVKQEPDSGKEDSKEHIKKIKKEKKVKKDKEDNGKSIKKEVTERRKLSIVIKDFRSQIVKPSTSKSSASSSRDKEREKEKRRKSKDRDKEHKSREKKSNGNVSDVSLSDEETYRKMLEYHTSSQWCYDDHVRSSHVREWDRDKYRRGRSRDDDRHSRHYRQRSRSRSRSRRDSIDKIDKKKLLEIARKNAISMLRSGTLPRNISENTKEKLVAKIKHGGQSIEELTNYCKKLSKAEDLGELSNFSDSDNDGDGKPRAFHHPFEVKDRGPIVMNIRNSVPIAPKQASELKAIMSQFPVSSGKQHQKVENTWVPVTTSNTSTTVSTVATISKPVVTLQKQIQEQLPELARPKPAPIAEPPKPLDPALSKPYDWKSDDHYLSQSIIPELAPPPQPPQVDVSEIISQRLNAMRKLQENPRDNEASKVLFETQQNMSQWAQSKYTPGQFLGSTDVRVLSVKELATGNQAWARKNQLIDTQPVTSGMGMHLLKKMGWTPGEGLGKEGTGSLTPLLLELKLDKRGLESNEEVFRQKGGNQNKGKKGGGPRRGGGPGPVPLASLEQKHPVSLLGELASKRRWGAPNYTLVHENGPAHAKHFVFKVRLNGIDYEAPATANNKKEAKSYAAKFCLQQLGILPS